MATSEVISVKTTDSWPQQPKIAATAKFFSKGQWKPRYLTLESAPLDQDPLNPSNMPPVSQCNSAACQRLLTDNKSAVLSVFKNEKASRKLSNRRQLIRLSGYYGIESGITIEKETNTLTILCDSASVMISFLDHKEQREHLRWEHWCYHYLGYGFQSSVRIHDVPATSLMHEHKDTNVKLYVADHRFCVASDRPPSVLCGWQIAHLRNYGPLHNKFCFHAGQRAGSDKAGMHMLLSSQSDQIHFMFIQAAQGKLSQHMSGHSSTARLPVAHLRQSSTPAQIHDSVNRPPQTQDLDQRHRLLPLTNPPAPPAIGSAPLALQNAQNNTNRPPILPPPTLLARRAKKLSLPDSVVLRVDATGATAAGLKSTGASDQPGQCAVVSPTVWALTGQPTPPTASTTMEGSRDHEFNNISAQPSPFSALTSSSVRDFDDTVFMGNSARASDNGATATARTQPMSIGHNMNNYENAELNAMHQHVYNRPGHSSTLRLPLQHVIRNGLLVPVPRYADPNVMSVRAPHAQQQSYMNSAAYVQHQRLPATNHRSQSRAVPPPFRPITSTSDVGTSPRPLTWSDGVRTPYSGGTRAPAPQMGTCPPQWNAPAAPPPPMFHFDSSGTPHESPVVPGTALSPELPRNRLPAAALFSKTGAPGVEHCASAAIPIPLPVPGSQSHSSSASARSSAQLPNQANNSSFMDSRQKLTSESVDLARNAVATSTPLLPAPRRVPSAQTCHVVCRAPDDQCAYVNQQYVDSLYSYYNFDAIFHPTQCVVFHHHAVPVVSAVPVSVHNTVANHGYLPMQPPANSSYLVMQPQQQQFQAPHPVVVQANAHAPMQMSQAQGVQVATPPPDDPLQASASLLPAGASCVQVGDRSAEHTRPIDMPESNAHDQDQNSSSQNQAQAQHSPSTVAGIVRPFQVPPTTPLWWRLAPAEANGNLRKVPLVGPGTIANGLSPPRPPVRRSVSTVYSDQSAVCVPDASGVVSVGSAGGGQLGRRRCSSCYDKPNGASGRDCAATASASNTLCRHDREMSLQPVGGPTFSRGFLRDSGKRAKELWQTFRRLKKQRERTLTDATTNSVAGSRATVYDNSQMSDARQITDASDSALIANEQPPPLMRRLVKPQETSALTVNGSELSDCNTRPNETQAVPNTGAAKENVVPLDVSPSKTYTDRACSPIEQHLWQRPQSAHMNMPGSMRNQWGPSLDTILDQSVMSNEHNPETGSQQFSPLAQVQNVQRGGGNRSPFVWSPDQGYGRAQPRFSYEQSAAQKCTSWMGGSLSVLPAPAPGSPFVSAQPQMSTHGISRSNTMESPCSRVPPTLSAVDKARMHRELTKPLTSNYERYDDTYTAGLSSRHRSFVFPQRNTSAAPVRHDYNNVLPNQQRSVRAASGAGNGRKTSIVSDTNTFGDSDLIGGAVRRLIRRNPAPAVKSPSKPHNDTPAVRHSQSVPVADADLIEPEPESESYATLPPATATSFAAPIPHTIQMNNEAPKVALPSTPNNSRVFSPSIRVYSPPPTAPPAAGGGSSMFEFPPSSLRVPSNDRHWRNTPSVAASDMPAASANQMNYCDLAGSSGGPSQKVSVSSEQSQTQRGVLRRQSSVDSSQQAPNINYAQIDKAVMDSVQKASRGSHRNQTLGSTQTLTMDNVNQPHKRGKLKGSRLGKLLARAASIRHNPSTNTPTASNLELTHS